MAASPRRSILAQLRPTGTTQPLLSQYGRRTFHGTNFDLNGGLPSYTGSAELDYAIQLARQRVPQGTATVRTDAAQLAVVPEQTMEELEHPEDLLLEQIEDLWCCHQHSHREPPSMTEVLRRTVGGLRSSSQEAKPTNGAGTPSQAAEVGDLGAMIVRRNASSTSIPPQNRLRLARRDLKMWVKQHQEHNRYKSCCHPIVMPGRDRPRCELRFDIDSEREATPLEWRHKVLEASKLLTKELLRGVHRAADCRFCLVRMSEEDGEDMQFGKTASSPLRLMSRSEDVSGSMLKSGCTLL